MVIRPSRRPVRDKQRVEHAGAGIEHDVDAGEQVLQRDAPGIGRILGRSQEAFGLVLRRGRRLADLEVAVLIDKDRVGHGAAGVDADNDWIGSDRRMANDGAAVGHGRLEIWSSSRKPRFGGRPRAICLKTQ